MARLTKPKKNRIWETEIEGDDGEPTEVRVEFTVDGKYVPARMYPTDLAHPEEFPEIDIISVTGPNGEDVPYDEDELKGDLEEYLADLEADAKYEYEERDRGDD